MSKEDPDYLFMFYDALANRDEESLKRLDIPHSSVFYVRAAIEADTGVKYTLDHVRKAMRAEGYENV
jgi:transposase